MSVLQKLEVIFLYFCVAVIHPPLVTFLYGFNYTFQKKKNA